jgi:hypothetical protein
VELGVPLGLADGALAAALMAGIVMDTATFAHPNATPRTLAVSAGLVAVGAPLSDISRRLYRTKPDAQLRLFGRVLGRLDSSADGLVTWSTLLDADFAATGAIPAHSEGIIDLLAQSETAEVAMVVKEQPDGTSRLSVRTKPGGVDATVLTGRFGGGGHTRAAGATIRLPLAEATAAAVSEAERLASPSPPAPPRTTSWRWSGGCRPRGAWATAVRSTRSPPACCRCSWGARRGLSSTTLAPPSATGPRSASVRPAPRTTSTVSARSSTGRP